LSAFEKFWENFEEKIADFRWGETSREILAGTLTSENLAKVRHYFWPKSPRAGRLAASGKQKIAASRKKSPRAEKSRRVAAFQFEQVIRSSDRGQIVGSRSDHWIEIAGSSDRESDRWIEIVGSPDHRIEIVGSPDCQIVGLPDRDCRIVGSPDRKLNLTSL
jgi:hypothetical protein